MKKEILCWELVKLDKAHGIIKFKLFRVSEPLIWGQIELRRNECPNYILRRVTYDYTKHGDDPSNPGWSRCGKVPQKRML